MHLYALTHEICKNIQNKIGYLNYKEVEINFGPNPFYYTVYKKNIPMH